MKFSKFKATAVALFVSTAVAPLVAAEKRQHGTHEHGVAQLMVAVEGTQVQMMLESPMFNLAGFGRPQTEEQVHEVEEVEHKLNDPLALFDLGSDCVAVSTAISGGAFGGEHGGEHHDEEHDDEKHEGEEHHDEEHHDESNHADAEVEWVLECPSMAANPVLRTQLFSQFEHLEQLNVEFITSAKQGSAQLTAANAELQL